MNQTLSTRLRITTYVALLTFCLAVMVPATAFAQSPKKSGNSGSILLQGTNADGTPGQAILKITQFANQNGQLVAIGTVTPVSTTSGAAAAAPTQVTLPVLAASGSCNILSLTLGPLHLNVLGLVVDLNQVVLNITAQPGSGNLLGNLLCDVAGLLNGGGALSGLLDQLTTLLNQILGAL